MKVDWININEKLPKENEMCFFKSSSNAKYVAIGYFKHKTNEDGLLGTFIEGSCDKSGYESGGIGYNVWKDKDDNIGMIWRYVVFPFA